MACNILNIEHPFGEKKKTKNFNFGYTNTLSALVDFRATGNSVSTRDINSCPRT